MNRSHTTPRSYSSDQLRAALGDVGGPALPGYLPDIVAQARHVRQRPAWAFLGGWVSVDIAVRRQGVPRAAVVFATLLMLVALLAASVVYIGSHLTQPERLLGLPTTPGAWERVVIETTSVTGRVASLAISPRGLLAAVGGDEPARLAVSTDGRTWTLVPDGQLPLLSHDSTFGMPLVVGTDRGFLMLQLQEVWASENGFDWRRIASGSTDPDLDGKSMSAAIAGGAGLVAVGDDSAWYSVDGSDWSLAEVPPLPAQILAQPEGSRIVQLEGVVAAGDMLVAWGTASADNEALAAPLLWASRDGRTWTSVVNPEMDSVTAVTSGPHGFIATGQAGSEPAVWLSVDGESWERTGDGAFTTHVLSAAAATSAGYVVIGSDGPCREGPCPGQQVVIWTSADGRTWSRVPSDGRFAGASGGKAIAWGSRFVVGGVSDGKPAIWISESDQSGSAANAMTSPPSVTPSSGPLQPVNFTGTWEATDPPLDSSHLTTRVIALPDGDHDMAIRDD